MYGDDDRYRGIRGGRRVVLMHAEDQARIGLLMLRRGDWNGKRIIPEAWVAETVRWRIAPPGRGAPEGWRLRSGP